MRFLFHEKYNLMLVSSSSSAASLSSSSTISYSTANSSSYSAISYSNSSIPIEIQETTSRVSTVDKKSIAE
ncbi:unnamed protein product [Rotaria socialis]